MNKLKYKLIKSIIQQIPLNSKLYLGDYVNCMIEDGFMTNLCQYEVNIDLSKTWYYKCYIVSLDFINYFLQELENNIELINYFIHYIISFDDEILMCVFDGDIFSIKNTLLIDDKLIENCKDSEIHIIFEDKIII